MEHEIRILEARLDDPAHAAAVVAMTAAYAIDPMGSGAPLRPAVLDRLVDGLRRHPTTVVFLAFAGERPVGIATCFFGFSTFAALPLLNVHDLAVLPDLRGRGLGRRLLAAVERKAREHGCAKLTLEVQEGNANARRTYEKAGFAQAEYNDAGGALFYAKPLLHR